MLLEKPEPATIRVSSLKVGHCRRLVILIIVDDEGCGEGRQVKYLFCLPFLSGCAVADTQIQCAQAHPKYS